jgi:hypothetical protein
MVGIAKLTYQRATGLTARVRFPGISSFSLVLFSYVLLTYVLFYYFFFFIDTFMSLAIPSLQLRLTTSLFSNLDSKLKTNSQYLSIDQCRVLVFIC